MSVCLVFTIIPLIASLLCQEGKQALKKTRQTDKQSINIKEGAIKCCKEIKITSPPNEWHNIPVCSQLFLFLSFWAVGSNNFQTRYWHILSWRSIYFQQALIPFPTFHYSTICKQNFIRASGDIYMSQNKTSKVLSKLNEGMYLPYIIRMTWSQANYSNLFLSTHNEFLCCMNTMLCPIKVDSNTIKLIVHMSCYCILLTLC